MKAECTWELGTDVLLYIDGTLLELEESPDFLHNKCLHGTITQGEINLTADQAVELGNLLINAAKLAKIYEDGIPKKEKLDGKERNSGHDR